ncbi:MAG: lmo0937 family membrane protein [Bacteroidota bacterium]
MNRLLYTLAIILLVLWAIGYFTTNIGSIIHILLVIAIIAILLRVIKGRDPL